MIGHYPSSYSPPLVTLTASVLSLFLLSGCNSDNNSSSDAVRSAMLLEGGALTDGQVRPTAETQTVAGYLVYQDDQSPYSEKMITLTIESSDQVRFLDEDKQQAETVTVVTSADGKFEADIQSTTPTTFTLKAETEQNDPLFALQQAIKVTDQSPLQISLQKDRPQAIANGIMAINWVTKLTDDFQNPYSAVTVNLGSVEVVTDSDGFASYSMTSSEVSESSPVPTLYAYYRPETETLAQSSGIEYRFVAVHDAIPNLAPEFETMIDEMVDARGDVVDIVDNSDGTVSLVIEGNGGSQSSIKVTPNADSNIVLDTVITDRTDIPEGSISSQVNIIEQDSDGNKISDRTETIILDPDSNSPLITIVDETVTTPESNSTHTVTIEQKDALGHDTKRELVIDDQTGTVTEESLFTYAPPFIYEDVIENGVVIDSKTSRDGVNCSISYQGSKVYPTGSTSADYSFNLSGDQCGEALQVELLRGSEQLASQSVTITDTLPVTASFTEGRDQVGSITLRIANTVDNQSTTLAEVPLTVQVTDESPLQLTTDNSTKFYEVGQGNNVVFILQDIFGNPYPNQTVDMVSKFGSSSLDMPSKKITDSNGEVFTNFMSSAEDTLNILISYSANGTQLASSELNLEIVADVSIAIRNQLEGWILDQNIAALNSADTSGLTDISYLFAETSGSVWNDLDLSGWDTSSVVTMEGAFLRAHNFNSDISGWDTTNVTNMSMMFSGAIRFNQNLSSWDITSVVDDSSAFFGTAIVDASFIPLTPNHDLFVAVLNKDIAAINNFDVSGLSSAAYLLSNLGAAEVSQLDLSKWDVSNMTNMSSLFEGSDFSSATDIGIAQWNTSRVQDMALMFRNTTSFNQDLSRWDTSSVTTMNGTFRDSRSFNGDLSGWNVGNVTHMGTMFYNATAFVGTGLSNWDVSNVIYMSYMFEGASNFSADISLWNTGKVITMENMFYRAGSFSQDLSGWNVSNVIRCNRFSSSSGGVVAPLFIHCTP